MPKVPSSSIGQPSPRPVDLPPNTLSIRDILDEVRSVGSKIHTIGIVKDVRLPIATRGTDYKTSITLYDLSTQYDGDSIELNVFCSAENAPKVNVGDVVSVRYAKLQRYRSNPLSLISSYCTNWHVFSASKIMKRSAKSALLPSPREHDRDHPPTDQICEYAAYMFHTIEKRFLPTQDEFQVMAKQSLNVKQKFSLLQDVRDGNFYDLIVQVAKDPFDFGDKITLYVSDYTENPNFYHYTWEGIQEGEADPYGYTSGEANSNKAWVGPYGKKSIQITCYEPHASYIRDEARADSWLSLRNVQVKFGRDGMNLEGFMREDRDSASAKISAQVLDTSDPSSVDDRLKEAVRRWRDYNKAKKADLKKLQADRGGRKRKADDTEKKDQLNSKQKRKLKRSQVESKVSQQGLAETQALGLNDLVVCESSDEPVWKVESILEPHFYFYQGSIEGQPARLIVPFVCLKYRVNVRVVDFHPSRLEDFACSRTLSACDCLSDNSENESSGDDDTDGEESMGSGDRIWEWRFMLQLEDASAKKKEFNRVWIVVDNSEAQYLTGLDATNLHRDTENLERLREKLFALWGDLEEHKAHEVAKEEVAKKRKPGENPPDSSDNEDNSPGTGAGKNAKGSVSNKPFTCCLRQYGVQVDEEQPMLADAGAGKKWQRVFGLFGTKING